MNAADRLARTRLAIIEDVHRSRHGGRLPPETGESGREPGQADARGEDEQVHPGRFGGLREAVRGWWQQHPAHLVMELAEPAVHDWARRHPMRLVAAAAAAGALLVLARPWKLVSATSLLLAALRSPQLSSLALSALARSRGAGDAAPSS